MSKDLIKQRKSGHLHWALDSLSQTNANGLEKVKLPYSGLPDRALDEIDLSAKFLGKKISYPFFISCMTGGPQETRQINVRLAKAAQKFNIPMGLGSIRIALRFPELLPTFQIRKYAPTIPLMANLGAVSLNKGLTWKDCQKAVDFTEADALVLHLNPLQEALQKGGSTNFKGLLPKISQIVEKLSVPIIVKEVGHGIDRKTAQSLHNCGVNIIDTAGVGGTSWAWIEAKIAGDTKKAEIFKQFGLTTYESIVECTQIKGLTVLGSGGIRTGMDIAKTLYLGCALAGIAQPFLVAALKSEEAVDTLCKQLISELKIATFCKR
ncbi:type 2 isopentenyl-diphosphate Delta-isomerase [Patescibacteria group bacterium]|nr:type 2 isopentenyl-diphosphate Delta-isomerase [Patescibacteria group bacterium]